MARLQLLALAVLCTWASIDAKQTEEEAQEEMFSLFDEKAKLEQQVQGLRAEVKKMKKKIKTGDYKDEDSGTCNKKCPTVAAPSSVEAESKPSIFLTLSDKKKRKASSARFLGKYVFKTKPLESIDAHDPRLVTMLRQGRPVVIRNSNLVKPAVDKWDAEFYAQNIGGRELSVQLSHSRQFLYYAKMEGEEFDWTEPFARILGVFPDFIDMVEKLEAKNNGSYSYFHTALTAMAQGPGMREDYDRFNWKWMDKVKPDHWGKLDTNLFIMGMPNVVTPAHYDGLQNLFAQIQGFKRCILFSPRHYKTLYPHPYGHPNDRQTQINFDEPNMGVFPRFSESEGLEAIIGPGDVLYIPTTWYHHIESEMDSMTVSMNFWFGGNNTNAKPAVPPKPGSSKKEAKEEEKKKKTEEDEEEEGEEEEEEDGIFRMTTYNLPDDTYLLDEIAELNLVRDVEVMITQGSGASQVKRILRDGFDHRFDLIKYTGIETTSLDRKKETSHKKAKEGHSPGKERQASTAKKTQRGVAAGDKAGTEDERHSKEPAEDEADDDLSEGEEFGDDDSDE